MYLSIAILFYLSITLLFLHHSDCMRYTSCNDWSADPFPFFIFYLDPFSWHIFFIYRSTSCNDYQVWASLSINYNAFCLLRIAMHLSINCNAWIKPAAAHRWLFQIGLGTKKKWGETRGKWGCCPFVQPGGELLWCVSVCFAYVVIVSGAGRLRFVRA